MRVTKELFIIPHKGEYILYAPLKGVVAQVNAGVISLLKRIEDQKQDGLVTDNIVDSLIKLGVIETDSVEEKVAEPYIYKGFKPTSVTLLPTLKCNLRCVYCYSEAGENVGNDMDIKTARTSINFIIQNSQELGTKTPHLHFHGGGEPFLKIDLVKEVVNYLRSEAEKNNLKPSIGGTSNGLISRENLEWITDNFDYINISIDGPEDIQNVQRPKANGQPSFREVVETIQFLEKKGFEYSTRSTITNDSVNRIPEIIEFFKSISSNKRFHIEPLFECGRCKKSYSRSPDPSIFLKKFIEAKTIFDGSGIEVFYSGDRFKGVSHYFCGAAGDNFFVTPQGNVTTCLEVCREDDPRADIFIIGRYDKKAGNLIFDDEKIKRLKNRNIDNMLYCQECIGKYSCAGDCLAKVHAQSGDLYDTRNNERCVITKGVIVYGIKEIAEG